jgi:hypothetical protein
MDLQLQLCGLWSKCWHAPQLAVQQLGGGQSALVQLYTVQSLLQLACVVVVQRVLELMSD